MPILTDEKQMRGALQMAARSPFEGADPGFIERFKADYTAMVDGKNVDARTTTRSDIQDEYIRDFYKASGQRLPRWLGGPGVNSIADREQSVRGQVDAWNAANPNAKFRPLPTDQEIEEETIRRATGAIKKQTQLERRSTGAGSSIGGFIGTAAGAMADPINFMSVGLGAGAGGYLRTALTEGAIGMASESAVQGFNYDFRKKVDPNYSAGDALTEIAAAGVGAAALSTGLKGLADVWQRAKTGSWPSHVRDAANVVTREAAVPSGRFEKSVDGATAHQAALQKSLDDLIQSRPVELPPEAFMQANARPGRVYDADGNSVGVRYEVVDADTLITSNRDDLSINPDFPQELQPRDRSRAMSQDQIAGIAANLQPERLGFSSDASTGAPIIGADGLVESGNGRVLAIRRAYQQGGIPADNYRNYLRSQNFDVDGIRNPVLVARRVTDLEDRVAFVTAANRSTAMRLGAAEQALSDARLLDGELMSRLDGADIKAGGNQAFTRGFMQKLPRAEQGNLIDKDGFLSQEGERRITSALMGRAYGEPAMLTRALEDTDNNIKSIAGALADSAGPWAVMRDAVSRGDIPAGMDITDDLVNAVRLVMKARDEGRAVRDVVNQGEMFGGPDELSKIVARAMFSDADLKRPVGRARLSEFLRDYATEAMKNDAGPRLFGDALGSADILKSSLERVGRNDLHRVAEERLTPENIQKLYESPETDEVAIMDAERLIMEVEEKQLGPITEKFSLTEADLRARVADDPVASARLDRVLDGAKLTDGGYALKEKDGSLLLKTLDESGDLTLMPEGKDLRIGVASVAKEKRGQGIARGLYEEAVRLAAERGGVLRSDLSVSDNAVRVYDALRRRGYDVRTNPLAEKTSSGGVIGKINDPDANWVFEVGPKPKPKPITIDLGDGRGERDLADILREADDEIAAAQELEACTIGKVAGE